MLLVLLLAAGSGIETCHVTPKLILLLASESAVIGVETVQRRE